MSKFFDTVYITVHMMNIFLLMTIWHMKPRPKKEEEYVEKSLDELVAEAKIPKDFSERRPLEIIYDEDDVSTALKKMRINLIEMYYDMRENMSRWGYDRKCLKECSFFDYPRVLNEAKKRNAEFYAYARKKYNITTIRDHDD